MPLILTPKPEEVIGTKDICPEEWNPKEGEPKQEWITILSFLRREVLDAARAAARKTVTVNGRSVEEYDDKILFNRLFAVQVKGWRMFTPEGEEIPYTSENMARLPWDLQGWLYTQIANCGGIVATRDLVVKADSGQVFDFRRQDALVGETAEPQVPDPV